MHQVIGKSFLLKFEVWLCIWMSKFFMRLSYANLRWNKLISLIATLHGETLTDKEIRNVDLFTWCSYLNLNPMSPVSHFQYRVEIIFEVTAKVNYHTIRTEFQMHVSSSVHFLGGFMMNHIFNPDNILKV